MISTNGWKWNVTQGFKYGWKVWPSPRPSR